MFISLDPQFSALPPVRVVFAVTMEGSARKVVTVRSALMVKNCLDVQMEVRLDSPSAPDSKSPSLSPTSSIIHPEGSLAGVSFSVALRDCNEPSTEPVVLPPILPGQSLAVPLHLTSWRLQARPKGMGLFFCKAPIHWTNVERSGEVNSSKRECQSTDFDDSPKRNFRYTHRFAPHLEPFL